MPETFGLSDSQDGCTPCDCDVGGALDNDCDVITGQCRCRPHMTGRNCSQPKQHYYIPTLHVVQEAEAPLTICTTQNQNYYGVSSNPITRNLLSYFFLIYSKTFFTELFNCNSRSTS